MSMSHKVWDALVIGAGIEGSATAYNLAKLGQETLLLEQFSLPHVRGSSHGLTRITLAAYPKHFYSIMMTEAHAIWKDLERATGLQLYSPCGLLLVDELTSRVFRETTISYKALNAKHEQLDHEALSKKFPMLKFDESFASLYDHEGGILWANKCLTAFQNEFVKHGGTIRDSQRVVGIQPGDIITVQTTSDRFLAKKLVITAGPWTNRLMGLINLKLPLKTTRVVVYYWKQTVDLYSVDKHFPALIFKDDEDDEIFCVPAAEYPGLVKICHGGGPEADPDERDKADNRNSLRIVMNFIKNHMTDVEMLPSITENCLYTITPDGDFILDYHPVWKNIVIGAGFSGHGFKLSPVVGKILAQLTTGSSPHYDTTPFGIRRFMK